MLHQISQEYAGIRQFATYEFKLGDGFTRIIEIQSNPSWNEDRQDHVVEVEWVDTFEIGYDIEADWDFMTLRQAKAFLDKSQKLQDMFAG
jgi:hypothetical protein